MITKKQKFKLPEPTLTSEQIQELVEDGSEESLTAMVMDHIKAGFAYGRVYCGTRFDDDELLSIVYQAMSAAAKRFCLGRQKFMAYCKPFIRGELHRAWDRKKPLGSPLPDFTTPTRGLFSQDDEPPSVIELDYTTFDFEAVDRETLQNKIRPWLPRLTKHERIVVDLVYFGGYSQTEAAKIMGTRRQAVLHVLNRVHEKLKRFICPTS